MYPAQEDPHFKKIVQDLKNQSTGTARRLQPTAHFMFETNEQILRIWCIFLILYQSLNIYFFFKKNAAHEIFNNNAWPTT